ncbi:MAG TPA: bifunctional demethylmenaquinone methyltransferase/2-methoxy-6-polyprenyl-1,4-benzoquinol methylase UbiE [Vicinamibacterales bacterium]|nr:bifunctional demethylmenaquinone methyltransferase/2-methoxy-6-polyprenyl-1,4-benzoquinol methylase UbiE [Vicinamibacterales bacterium]
MHDDGTDVSKTPARIAGMFDAIAGRYDFLNHFLSGGIDRRWRARAIRSLALTGRETVLDVCTGTGDLAIEAMQAAPSAARVVGVDFAGAMLAIGHDKLRRAGAVERITLLRGDAMRIPLADRSVDGVTVGFGIRNVADVPAACREMLRVLKPGGRIAILEFAVPTTPVFRDVFGWYMHTVLPRLGRAISRHQGAYKYLQASIDAWLTPAEFVTILRQSGFVEIHAVPLTLGAVFLYEARR